MLLNIYLYIHLRYIIHIYMLIFISYNLGYYNHIDIHAYTNYIEVSPYNYLWYMKVVDKSVVVQS